MITSVSNPRIKEARKLQRRRRRYADQRLLVEGTRLLQDVIETGARPEVIFYAPELISSNRAGLDLVETIERMGVERLACSVEVFAALAETVTPQGVAAVVPLPQLPLPALSSLALILDQVRDPGNAGALLRSAEASGVDQALCAPGTVDPFNDKAVRAGMGAHFRLPLRICQSWDEVLAHLGPDQQLYLAQAGAAMAYDQVEWRQPAALIVGGEAAGASRQARRSACPISIPMLGRVESLNAAMAGAVILFEAARQRRLMDVDECA